MLQYNHMRDTSPSTINMWLTSAAIQLRAAQIASARLDAELLLGYVLRRPRSWLHAHDEVTLASHQQRNADRLLARRCNYEPLAYLTKHKEFYGRDFIISPAVLVPRPETETMIELLLHYRQPHHKRLIDVGTGSGVVAITSALELPDVYVEACDIDAAALAVARRNGTKLGALIQFYQSDLLSKAQHSYDIIMANLPYVDPSWQRDSRETAHEPQQALFAEEHGLDLIYQLLEQTDHWLAPHGLLILEADPCQYQAITTKAAQYHLRKLTSQGYAIAFTKATHK